MEEMKGGERAAEKRREMDKRRMEGGWKECGRGWKCATIIKNTNSRINKNLDLHDRSHPQMLSHYPFSLLGSH